MKTPGFDQFYRILLETRHQRPVMPVQGFYMGAIERAVDAAIYGKRIGYNAAFALGGTLTRTTP